MLLNLFCLNFSEQQIVDCYGTDGCKGGHEADNWLYVAAIGVHATDDFYNYTSGSTKTV